MSTRFASTPFSFKKSVIVVFKPFLIFFHWLETTTVSISFSRRKNKTMLSKASNDAEEPFDMILDLVTGSDPNVTDYVLEVTARCVTCGAEITEKTLG
jgi:hypothetical protein